MRRSAPAVAVCLLLVLGACDGSGGGSGSGGSASSGGSSGGSSAGDTTPTTSTPTTAPQRTTATTLNVRAIVEKVLASEERFKRDATTAQPAVFVSSNDVGKDNLAGTTQYITAVIQHADTIWTDWFKRNNLQEPWVGYKIVQPGTTYQSSCSINSQTSFRSNFPNAFYCQRDMNTHDRGMLVFPVETIAKMWTGNIFERRVSNLKRVGDFAAAMMIAHEFGHHIQDELSQQLNVAAPAGSNSELIADCFSGVWAYSVFLDNILEAGDIDEAVNALGVIGDNAGSHGTGAERQNAFLIGYTGSKVYPRGGVPENCIKAYWP